MLEETVLWYINKYKSLLKSLKTHKNMSEQQYWLCKSEPDNYSIEELEDDKVTPWDGVRNYGACNYMRDGMSVGDLCFFYHSNHQLL